MKPVIIQTEARREREAVMAWNDEQTPGVGQRLRTEVEQANARLRRNPEWCPPHKQPGLRKMPVSWFPYSVFFMELPDCIWAAAIANMHRRPDYWMSRRIERE